MRRVHRGVNNFFAALISALGKFNNKNCVLGGQTNQHDQPNLRVHVQRLAADMHEQQRAKHSEGDSKQNVQRQNPTFIQRGQQQEHRKKREREDNWRIGARFNLLIRGSSPLIGHAVWKRGRGDFFNGLDGITRTISGTRCAIHLNGVVHVVTRCVVRANLY